MVLIQIIRSGFRKTAKPTSTSTSTSPAHSPKAVESAASQIPDFYKALLSHFGNVIPTKCEHVEESRYFDFARNDIMLSLDKTGILS